MKPSNYLLVLIGSACAIVLLCAALWEPLIRIARDDDPGWYRDFAGRQIPEIHDEDLFYHGIGPSVAAAKAADIIILGPSFVSYAFDGGALRQFESRERLAVYNMAFIGIRAGEFSRRIIERWSIRPKLWVINVDDQFVHFFSHAAELTIGPHAEPIRTLEMDRLHGILSAVSRTLRWRAEDFQAEWRGEGPGQNDIYRNSKTGDVDLSKSPRYAAAAGNAPLRISRDPDCHATSESIAIGREFLQSFGGVAVLTLVPHSQYCPLQAREIAAALGSDLILPPPEGYSTVDAGGHLDHASAVKFTDFFLSHLSKSPAFKKAFVRSLP